MAGRRIVVFRGVGDVAVPAALEQPWAMAHSLSRMNDET